MRLAAFARREEFCRVNAGKLFACTAVGLAVATSANAAAWNVIQQQGRAYVSFADVAIFYQFANYQHANGSATLRSDRRGVRAQAGTSEFFINGVRFLSDFPILNGGDQPLISAADVSRIIEPVLRPSRIANAEKVETVILDPGHGGSDSGTTNFYGSEKQFALAAALNARTQLQRAGYKVEMTRSSDVNVSLEERAALANRFSHAVFISIHFNSGGGAGAESYFLAPDGVPSNAADSHLAATETLPNENKPSDPRDVALSAAVQGAVLSKMLVFDRGVRHARFKVLRDVRIPAVLLEAGFLTDSAEGRRIATPQFQAQLGEAISEAVVAYDAAINYRPPPPTVAAAEQPSPSSNGTK